MNIEDGITVDLRSLSKDTRDLLRWVLRDECTLDDDDRLAMDEYSPLVGEDPNLLQRVNRKLRRTRCRLTADEARCLCRVIESVQSRLGDENLEDVDALMRGGDDEAFMEPYPYLPDQPNANRDEQDEELNKLSESLSTAEEAEFH